MRSLAPLAPLAVATTILATLGCGSRPREGLDPGPAGAAKPCAAPGTTGACQYTNSPDPLPATVDCAAAERGYTFLDPPLWTFEDDDNRKLARAMYSYTDRSQAIASFSLPNDQDPRLPPVRKSWEPPTTEIQRCHAPGDPSKPANPINRAIHIQGGPFLSWGGGVGISMKDFQGIPGAQVCDTTMEVPERLPEYCRGRDPVLMDTPGEGNDPTLNFSAWEGVSFWARRGPDSQGGFRVLVGDRFTDDDVAYVMYRDKPSVPRYCERVRECSCMNHQGCKPPDGPSLDGAPPEPASDLSPVPTECRNDILRASFAMGAIPTFCGKPEPYYSGDQGSGSSNIQCNTCADTRCEEEWPAYPGSSDVQFVNRPCLPYTFRNGISASYCFDPQFGERPAEPDQQCGDHWTKSVSVSTEWRFYTVPFSAMTQQGFAKRFPKLDLTNLSVIRFTWDGGWIDYWIDDVRLYRRSP